MNPIHGLLQEDQLYNQKSKRRSIQINFFGTTQIKLGIYISNFGKKSPKICLGGVLIIVLLVMKLAPPQANLLNYYKVTKIKLRIRCTSHNFFPYNKTPL